MYQPIFDDNINDEDLSPLDNFVSLTDLVKSGGVKAERARKIINQFTSNAINKQSRETLSEGHIQNSNSKKTKYYNSKRFKN